MEVEAVDEGVIEALLVDAGTEGVKVNAPIAKLKDEGDKGETDKDDTSSDKSETSDTKIPLPPAPCRQRLRRRIQVR